MPLLPTVLTATGGTRRRTATVLTTPVPTPWERHLMNRLGCGFSRQTLAQLRAAGSAEAWLDQQLQPATVPESKVGQAIPGWFPDQQDAPATKWANNVNRVKGGWEYAADLASVTMMRRIHSRRQVFETLVDFWSNHLHVHASHDLGWVHRASYDEVIRTHALGRFDAMLEAATLHPAMLLYLDNWRSVRGAFNENHGRELLELHTVGRAAGYSEQEVKDAAKILSGWTVDAYKTWEGRYDAGRHTTGPVSVLGFTAANAAADGSALTRDFLRHLAHHPATARRIAGKLARYFVADEPSEALVDDLARVFRQSGTDITATIRALVAHPEFRASRGTLVRNPVEDFVATCRVLGVTAQAPVSSQSFARAALWAPRTTLLYQWPRPDGLPVGDAAWATASRMLNSFRMHWNLAGGWWPTAEVTHRARDSFLPGTSVRFDVYVDHLSRVLLGKRSSKRILAACVAATGYPATTTVTKEHALCTWLHPRLVATLLDSPDHMRR